MYCDYLVSEGWSPTALRIVISIIRDGHHLKGPVCGDYPVSESWSPASITNSISINTSTTQYITNTNSRGELISRCIIQSVARIRIKSNYYRKSDVCIFCCLLFINSNQNKKILTTNLHKMKGSYEDGQIKTDMRNDKDKDRHAQWQRQKIILQKMEISWQEDQMKSLPHVWVSDRFQSNHWEMSINH